MYSSVYKEEFRETIYITAEKQETSIREAKEIIRSRLHMTKLPYNYKKKEGDEKCWLCGKEDGKVEHYFECEKTEKLKDNCGTNINDMKSKRVTDLIKMSKFVQKVEVLLEPKMTTIKNSDNKQTKNTSQQINNNLT